MTQKLMAELFGMDVRTISEHLINIFKSNELDENSVIRKFRTTAAAIYGQTAAELIMQRAGVC